MIKRGLSTLDVLDATEANEVAELARYEASANALAAASSFLDDPVLDPRALADLPNSFWAGLGLSPPLQPFSLEGIDNGGRTPEVVVGS